MLAELPAGRLVEGADLLGEGITAQYAQILGEAEREASGEPRKVLRLGEGQERADARLQVIVEPGLEALLDPLAIRRQEMLAGDQLDAGLEGGLAALQARDLVALPDDAAMGREGDLRIGSVRQGLCPAGQLLGDNLARRVARSLAVNTLAPGVSVKRNPCNWPT
ncbi:hypothetical protein A7A08_03077 [Methyloligella halotolerans]|uniref:Uncharacterized protein n=1 Tax=Methyloligella halotolerans TaxID=1177755 RepID=A0A1E2RV87_9HYPH|nr:hypothetical protein A7A08_03077 [Methyloligella halotolerans]